MAQFMTNKEFNNIKVFQILNFISYHNQLFLSRNRRVVCRALPVTYLKYRIQQFKFSVYHYRRVSKAILDDQSMPTSSAYASFHQHFRNDVTLKQRLQCLCKHTKSICRMILLYSSLLFDDTLVTSAYFHDFYTCKIQLVTDHC